MSSHDPDLSRMVVTEEDRVQISGCLQRLMVDSGATYSMVLDRSGQILASESDNVRPEMVHLGALLAATYASTQEMARILKEDGFRTLLQEGLKEKIFTETIKDRWLLVVIFDHQAHIGMVKVLARRSGAMLANILELVERRAVEHRNPRFRHLGKATFDTIDLIFKDDNRSDDE